MNKVIITGNLCKDIEIRYTNNNTPVTQNTVAVKNDFKNANNEYDSEFINIVVWQQKAEFLKNYAAKGSKVLVEGRLTTRTYDRQDGTKGYVTEVIADKVELLNSPAKSEKTDAEIVKDIMDNKDPFADFGGSITVDDNFLE